MNAPIPNRRTTYWCEYTYKDGTPRRFTYPDLDGAVHEASQSYVKGDVKITKAVYELTSQEEITPEQIRENQKTNPKLARDRKYGWLIPD